jgi:CheY-like chemotaxis protein
LGRGLRHDGDLCPNPGQDGRPGTAKSGVGLGQAVGSTRGAQSVAPARILIVDDEPFDRDVLAQELELLSLGRGLGHDGGLGRELGQENSLSAPEARVGRERAVGLTRGAQRWRPRRSLIVDDEPFNRDVLAQELELLSLGPGLGQDGSLARGPGQDGSLSRNPGQHAGTGGAAAGLCLGQAVGSARGAQRWRPPAS